MGKLDPELPGGAWFRERIEGGLVLRWCFGCMTDAAKRLALFDGLGGEIVARDAGRVSAELVNVYLIRENVVAIAALQRGVLGMQMRVKCGITRDRSGPQGSRGAYRH
jgi:hypothetical protein